MNITIRSSDIAAVLEHPGELLHSSGPATVVVDTGAFIPRDSIRQLAQDPKAAQDFMVHVQHVLDELAEEEQEGEDMVSAWPEDTGLPNAIKIIPGNPRHGPRIKVALDPTDRFTGDWASMAFGEAPGSFDAPRSCRDGGPRPSAALERKLREFIELNRAALFAFDRAPDQGGISGAQLIKGLRKVGT
jgi:hypothetical protein